MSMSLSSLSLCSDLPVMKDETVDSLLGRELLVIQDRYGYRFSVDSVLLAYFARIKRRDQVLDLGSGNGIISLLLSKIYPEAIFLAVEIQAHLADQALRNSIINGVWPRMMVVHEDLQNLPRLLRPGSLQVVISNPPYQSVNSGRINPNPSRARARHEVFSSLETFISVAGILLKNGGRAYFVLPSFRLAELILLLKKHHLEPKTLQMLYPYAWAQSRHFLIEAYKNCQPGLRILPPLVLYRERGIMSEAIENIYRDFQDKI
ncbi:MAG: methyltransferase [bacterium]|nr:methyltransferase [bacterium]